MFIKTGSSTWSTAKAVWMYLQADWVKVWPLSGIFANRVPFIGFDSGTTYSGRLTNSGDAIVIGSSYVGNNAQWNANGWTITGYQYAWYYYDADNNYLGTLRSGTPSGWTSTTGQDTLPTSIWTATNSTNADTNYLAFEVVATASNSSYNGTASSEKIKVIRDVPLNLTKSISNPTAPSVGVALTYSSTWDTAQAYKDDSTRRTIYWYRNSVSSTTGGTFVGSGTSYTPVSADVNNYIYVVETRYNSGTDYYYGTTTGVAVSVITTAKVSQTPVVDVYPTISSTSGYKTKYRSGLYTDSSTNGTAYNTPAFRGNTGTWNPDPTSVNWRFQYSSNGSTNWTSFYDFEGLFVGGNDTSENQNHDWYIDDFYGSGGALGTTINSTGYYVRFASEGLQGTTSVDWNYSSALGPIYAAPTAPGTPTLTWVSTFDSNNSYISAYWSAATTKFTYYLQYYNGTSWITLGSGTTSDYTVNSPYSPILAPHGNYSYRIINMNADNVFAKSASVSFNAAPPPGNVSDIRPFSFSAFTSNLFLTTGIRTTEVRYTIKGERATGFSIGPLSQSASSSTAYLFNNDLSGYFTGKSWNTDTYSPSTTYYLNNTVWYAGNEYRLTTTRYASTFPYNEIGVFGQVPADTNNNVNSAYWSRITTVTYNAGDYVYYNGRYYFAISSFNGRYPTNGTYWDPNALECRVYVTPYNSSKAGTESISSLVYFKPNAASNTPPTITSGPTFSSIAKTSFTTTYQPSFYATRVIIDVKKGSPLSSISGYPKTVTPTVEANNTDSPSGLTEDTDHTVYITPRYRYTDSVYYDGVQVTGTVKTLTTTTAPTISSVTHSFPTSTTVTVTGGGPYYQIYWNTSGTAPSNTSTYYDAASTSTSISETLLPSGDATYYFWARSSSENLGNTTSSGNATAGTFSDWSARSSMTPFKTPTSLSASSNSNTKITLTWSGGGGTGYQAYWTGSDTTRPTDGSTTYDIALGSSSPYDWTSMSRGTTYYFYVRSIYTNSGTTYYTNWYPAAAPGASGKALLYAPKTPTNFAGTVASSSQVDLSWTAPTTGTSNDAASGYDIYYSTSSTAPTSGTSATTTSTSTTKSITGLSGSTTYYFWLRATNADAKSDWTSRLDKTTSAANVAPTITDAAISPTSGTAGTTEFTASATVAGTPTPTVTYQWQYFNTSFQFANVPGATSSTYTPPSDFNTTYPNYGFYCLITATNTAGTATSRPSATLNNPTVSKPADGTVSLAGTAKVGETLTATTSGWTGSPTSYDIRIVRGTQFVIISETLKASDTDTSVSYVVESGDVGYYFKAFASATNSAGTSSFAASSELGPTVAASSGSAPVLISITGNNSLAVGGTFTWSFSNSPTAYSLFVQGPTGTVYTTSNAYTYTGTTFRPGYDGTGWQGAGNYTAYVSARNAYGDSVVSSQTTYMS
jgi:hypothetical protein